MTDQTPDPRTIPADKVQAVADWLLNEEMANGGLDEKIAPQLAARAQMCWEARAQLLALLRPTMADMTPEERAACQWLQADVKGEDSRVVIVNTNWINGSARIMRPTTRMAAVPWERVTPRPDLPRMMWPGDTPHTGPTVTFSMPAPTAPAPALPDGWLLADHETRGRVIVTRPEPDNDGEVVIVCPLPDRVTRADIYWCNNDKLTYLDQEPHHDPR